MEKLVSIIAEKKSGDNTLFFNNYSNTEFQDVLVAALSKHHNLVPITEFLSHEKSKFETPVFLTQAINIRFLFQHHLSKVLLSNVPSDIIQYKYSFFQERMLPIEIYTSIFAKLQSAEIILFDSKFGVFYQNQLLCGTWVGNDRLEQVYKKLTDAQLTTIQAIEINNNWKNLIIRFPEHRRIIEICQFIDYHEIRNPALFARLNEKNDYALIVLEALRAMMINVTDSQIDEKIGTLFRAINKNLINEYRQST